MSMNVLVHAKVDDEQLSDKEIATLPDVLLLAGHVTTTMLLGNTILCLDAHPDEFQRVREDRSCLPSVVEESLRLLPPFAVTSRVTTEETQVADVTIPTDQLVMVWLGAANRDPRVFDDPTCFRPGRNASPHLTFSRGIHYCIGAGPARLEGGVALNVLFDHFRALAITPEEPPQFIRSAQMLNAYKLPLAVTPLTRAGHGPTRVPPAGSWWRTAGRAAKCRPACGYRISAKVGVCGRPGAPGDGIAAVPYLWAADPNRMCVSATRRLHVSAPWSAVVGVGSMVHGVGIRAPPHSGGRLRLPRLLVSSTGIRALGRRV